MQKYIVRLTAPYNDETKERMDHDNLSIVFQDNVLKDLVIIESDKTIEELRTYPLFRKVEKERIGSVFV